MEAAMECIRVRRVLEIQTRELRQCVLDGVLLPRKPAANSRTSSGAAQLTKREIEVVRLIVGGMSTGEIASNPHIAFKTAAAHRSQILQKLEVTNAAGVVREAVARGIAS